MLHELQTSFRQVLLGSDTADMASLVLGDSLTPEARLDIYRHHVVTTLTDVLQAAYPVLCRLVDTRFFAYVAHHYIQQHPPMAPCLFTYGDAMAEFLWQFPACRELPYLPDVARLEWALNVAWYAEDKAALEPARLGAVPPDVLGAVRLQFDPAVSYIASPWPIVAIWQAHQPDADPQAPIPLDAGGIRLEVRRLHDDVTFRPLPAGAFAWRQALQARHTLEAAIDAALDIDPHFDLTAALQAVLAEGLLVDLMLP